MYLVSQHTMTVHCYTVFLRGDFRPAAQNILQPQFQLPKEWNIRSIVWRRKKLSNLFFFTNFANFFCRIYLLYFFYFPIELYHGSNVSGDRKCFKHIYIYRKMNIFITFPITTDIRTILKVNWENSKITFKFSK